MDDIIAVIDVDGDLEFMRKVIEFCRVRFPAIAYFMVFIIFKWQMQGLIELQKMGITAFMRG